MLARAVKTLNAKPRWVQLMHSSLILTWRTDAGGEVVPHFPTPLSLNQHAGDSEKHKWLALSAASYACWGAGGGGEKGNRGKRGEDCIVCI